MAIDRLGNARVTEVNKVPRNYSSERPLNEEGDAFARCGYSTLSRADQHAYFNRNRRILATQVQNDPNSDVGDETYTNVNVVY